MQEAPSGAGRRAAAAKKAAKRAAARKLIARDRAIRRLTAKVRSSDGRSVTTATLGADALDYDNNRDVQAVKQMLSKAAGILGNVPRVVNEGKRLCLF